MTQLDWLLLYKELQRQKFKGNLDLRYMNFPLWFRIPDNLIVLGWIDLSETNISKLPKNLECSSLYLDACQNFKELSEYLKVKDMIDLSKTSIQILPKNLQCNGLYLNNCINLKKLSEGLQVNYLDIYNSSITKEYCEQQKQEGKISYNNLRL